MKMMMEKLSFTAIINYMLSITLLGITLSLLVSHNIQQTVANNEDRKEFSELYNKLDKIRITSTVDTNISNIFLKILILNKNTDPELAKKIAVYVHKYSELYNRNPNLTLSIIYVESNFNPKAISSVGARGLMQIMPFWKEIYKQENIVEIEANIKYGLQILAIYEKMYSDLNTALIAYNRGPGIVDAALRRGQNPSNGYASRIMETFNKLESLDVQE
jgi:hypothetical protein